MTLSTVLSDRLWFNRNPYAVVRFRKERDNEFANLRTQGHEPPVFTPNLCERNNQTLTWVAVVDLLQLMKEAPFNGDGSRMRLRMRTIPLRTSKQRSSARKELIYLVAKELMHHERSDHILFNETIAA